MRDNYAGEDIFAGLKPVSARKAHEISLAYRRANQALRDKADERMRQERLRIQRTAEMAGVYMLD